MTLTLSRPAVVRGKVVDDKGKPVVVQRVQQGQQHVQAAQQRRDRARHAPLHLRPLNRTKNSRHARRRRCVDTNGLLTVPQRGRTFLLASIQPSLPRDEDDVNPFAFQILDGGL